MPIGVGAPGTVASASGGKVYAFNNINETTITVVAPANVQRQRIIFFNPGTKDAFIGPALAYSSATAASPTALAPTTSALGGMIPVFAGGSVTITGECSGQWVALMAVGNGANNPFTVIDSNV